MELNIHRGDVFYIQGPSYCVGSEMSKTRPAVVVSNEKNNIYAPLVEIVYLTTAEKKPLPTHVPITIYGRKNTVLCESVYTVSKERVGSYLCTLDSDEMALVDAALLISLGLSAPALAVAAAAEEEPLASFQTMRDSRAGSYTARISHGEGCRSTARKGHPVGGSE